MAALFLAHSYITASLTVVLLSLMSTPAEVKGVVVSTVAMVAGLAVVVAEVDLLHQICSINSSVSKFYHRFYQLLKL